MNKEQKPRKPRSNLSVVRIPRPDFQKLKMLAVIQNVSVNEAMEAAVKSYCQLHKNLVYNEFNGISEEEKQDAYAN